MDAVSCLDSANHVSLVEVHVCVLDGEKFGWAHPCVGCNEGEAGDGIFVVLPKFCDFIRCERLVDGARFDGGCFEWCGAVLRCDVHECSVFVQKVHDDFDEARRGGFVAVVDDGLQLHGGDFDEGAFMERREALVRRNVVARHGFFSLSAVFVPTRPEGGKCDTVVFDLVGLGVVVGEGGKGVFLGGVVAEVFALWLAFVVPSADDDGGVGAAAFAAHFVDAAVAIG